MICGDERRATDPSTMDHALLGREHRRNEPREGRGGVGLGGLPIDTKESGVTIKSNNHQQEGMEKEAGRGPLYVYSGYNNLPVRICHVLFSSLSQIGGIYTVALSWLYAGSSHAGLSIARGGEAFSVGFELGDRLPRAVRYLKS